MYVAFKCIHLDSNGHASIQCRESNWIGGGVESIGPARSTFCLWITQENSGFAGNLYSEYSSIPYFKYAHHELLSAEPRGLSAG